MSARLTKPPLLEPISLEEAKTHLRISHDTEDAFITLLIKASRLRVEAETGQALLAQSWSLAYNDWPSHGIISLRPLPIMKVVSLKILGQEREIFQIDPAHYYWEGKNLILRERGIWPRPSRAFDGIVLDLLCGYGETSQQVPEPLRLAILLLIAHWYEHRGDEAWQGLPLSFRHLLEPYRELRL